MADETPILKEDQKIMRFDKPPKRGFWGNLRWLVLEALALIFWVYVVVKLAIFDIDVYLANRFVPEYAWLLNLKFFILIGLVALVWLITKSKYILSWSAYIIFYPLIITFLKIPVLILRQKSWILAFAFLNAVFSFYKSIKYNFIISSLFLCSVAIVLTFSNSFLLWGSILTIFIILLIVYIHRFILVFKPSSVFQIYIKVFSWFRRNVPVGLDENLRNLPIESLDQRQLTTRTTNLQSAVIFNRACLFAAKKIRDYQNSRLNIISHVLNLLLLIIFTVASFTCINYGLYKIDPEYFRYTALPNLFTFIYYSFYNLFNSLQEIPPNKAISQAFSMTESFLSLFLVAIFVSLLLSVRSQRDSEEINEAIHEFEKQGNAMENLIREEYKLDNIEAAIAELNRLKAGLVNFIYQLSKSID